MKRLITIFSIMCGLVLGAALPSYATTEMEKAFVDAYKKAYEAKDETTLKSFLYTKGADPEILEFYTMMMTGELGGNLVSINLVDLTPEDVKKAEEIQPLPSGGNAKLTLKPSKKLVLKVETKDANGSSSSTSQTFVAELDGKYVIPVPGPAK